MLSAPDSLRRLESFEGNFDLRRLFTALRDFFACVG